MKYAKQEIIKAANDASLPSEMLRLLLMHLPGGSRKETWNYYVSELIASGAPVDFVTLKTRRRYYLIPRYIMWHVGINILNMPVSEVAGIFSQSHCMRSHVFTQALPGMCINPKKYFKPYLHLDFVRHMIEQNTPKVKKYLVS